MGDVAGGALIQVTLLLAAAWAAPLLLAATIGVAGVALAVARRLHRGYQGALARSLTQRADQISGGDLGRSAAFLQTVGGFDLSQFRPLTTGRPAPPATRPPVTEAVRPRSAEERRLSALTAADPGIVREALRSGVLTSRLMEPAIGLLAWDDAAPDAIEGLRAVAQSETERLVRHLLDPEEDFAIRRRLVLVLAGCPTAEAFEGLFRALEDRRFEVRYRAGRALNHLRGANSSLTVDRERVLAVVLNEVAVGRGVWESRQLIDAADDEWATTEADLLRTRASRSLEHVFNLLALILPREPLRLAYQGLHTGDQNLRGTALEYLETVLPKRVRQQLWRFLEPGEPPAAGSGRTPDQALEQLLQSRESIVLALRALHQRTEEP